MGLLRSLSRIHLCNYSHSIRIESMLPRECISAITKRRFTRHCVAPNRLLCWNLAVRTPLNCFADNEFFKFLVGKFCRLLNTRRSFVPVAHTYRTKLGTTQETVEVLVKSLRVPVTTVWTNYKEPFVRSDYHLLPSIFSCFRQKSQSLQFFTFVFGKKHACLSVRHDTFALVSRTYEVQIGWSYGRLKEIFDIISDAWLTIEVIAEDIFRLTLDGHTLFKVMYFCIANFTNEKSILG